MKQILIVATIIAILLSLFVFYTAMDECLQDHGFGYCWTLLARK